MTHLSAILKDAYLPAFRNQITTDPSPFMEKIRKVPLTNDVIKASAPLGLNGGFAFGATDGGTAPDAGAQRYAGFTLPSKNMYVNIEISDKTVKLANSNASAMLNAFDQEVRGAYNAANFNVGRALFGDGSGKLCTISAASGSTITVDDTSKLREGLIVDLFAKSALQSTTASARIIAINRATGVVTLDKAAGSVAEGFVTVQKSFNNEICGIGAVMNDSVAAIYGIMKNGNDWIKPIVKDAEGDIGDIVLYDGVSEASKYKNSKIDMLLCGDEAFKAYQLYMKSHNTVIVDKTMKFKGGAVGYTLNVGSREVVLVNESFVPANEIWGVETGAWQFHHTDLDFASVSDSVAFERVPGTTYYTALLAMYGNLICENPGGCVRFTNCASKG
jgi:hypothetical protein